MSDEQQAIQADKTEVEIIDENVSLLQQMTDETREQRRTKVERSPKYSDILRGYIRLRNEPTFTIKGFHTIVKKLDPEISIDHLRRWEEKMQKVKEIERKNKIRIMAEGALNSETTIEGIRDAGIQIFYLKVTEFLRNPDMLDAMSFAEALKLYTAIEKLALSTKELDLKRRDTNRKDALTLFSMQLLSGKAGLKELDELKSSTEELPDGQNSQGAIPPTTGTPPSGA